MLADDQTQVAQWGAGNGYSGEAHESHHIYDFHLAVA